MLNNLDKLGYSKDDYLQYLLTRIDNRINELLTAGIGGITNITLDSQMSDDSSNAVMNRIIKAYVDGSIENIISMVALKGANKIIKSDSKGKLDPSLIPDIQSGTIFVVDSEQAMLSLDAKIGDRAIRTDSGNTYILFAEPASTLSNWVVMSNPSGGVSSVNGKTGAVTLSKSDINLGNVDNTSDINKPVSTATKQYVRDAISEAITSVLTANYTIGA